MTINIKNLFYSSLLSFLLIACGGGDGPKDTTNGELAGTRPVPVNPNTNNPGPMVDGIEFTSTTYTVSESGATAAITVRRNGDAASAVSVTYNVDVNASSATAAQDYVKVQGILNWAINDSQPKTFYVPIKGDNLNDPNEYISLLLQPVNNALLANNTIATLNIQDVSCNGVLDANIIVDTVITDACVIVSRSIAVKNNAKLTINPGVTLIFQTGAGFNVEAGSYLNADGSVSQPIVFTAESQTPGYWRGIQFTNSNDLKNILNYVTVEYAGAGYNGTANVNLFGTGASVSITNSTLSYSSGYGFQTYYTGKINSFSNNRFFANALNPVEISPHLVEKLDTQSSYRGNTIDAIKVVSTTSDNTISTTQIWQALNVPYSVGSFEVGSTLTGALAAVLTIEPGTILKFRINSVLTVNSNGTLLARGTTDKRILFTADSVNPLTGFWNGITYYNSNNNNILDYVTVEYGGGNGFNSNIFLWFTNITLTMTNSTSRFSSGYGLRIDQQATVRFPAFSNNVFTKNDLEPIKIPATNVDIFNSSIQLTGNAIDRIYIDTLSTSPAITTTLRWPKAEVNYSVNRLIITADVTIEPGVEIQVRNDAIIGRISVEGGGSLNAIGTASQPIIIRGELSPRAGYWQGLRFWQSNSVLNNLQFVTVSDAGKLGNAANTAEYATISVNLNSSVTIENSTISDSAAHGISVLETIGTGMLLGDVTTNTFVNIDTVRNFVNISRY